MDYFQRIYLHLVCYFNKQLKHKKKTEGIKGNNTDFSFSCFNLAAQMNNNKIIALKTTKNYIKLYLKYAFKHADYGRHGRKDS